MLDDACQAEQGATAGGIFGLRILEARP